MGIPSREHRNSEYGPETANFLSLGPLKIGVGQNVVDMNRPSLRYNTPGYRISPWGRDRISLKKFFVSRREPVGDCQAIDLTVRSCDGSGSSVAKPCGVFNQSLKYWLKIEG